MTTANLTTKMSESIAIPECNPDGSDVKCFWCNSRWVDTFDAEHNAWIHKECDPNYQEDEDEDSDDSSSDSSSDSSEDSDDCSLYTCELCDERYCSDHYVGMCDAECGVEHMCMRCCVVDDDRGKVLCPDCADVEEDDVEEDDKWADDLIVLALNYGQAHGRHEKTSDEHWEVFRKYHGDTDYSPERHKMLSRILFYASEEQKAIHTKLSGEE